MKNRIIITASAVLAALCVVAGGIWLAMGSVRFGSPVAEIYSNGELYGVFPLNEERSFTIEDGSGYNKVEIRDGAIAVTDADCPDRVCVHTGAISDGAVPIVCLPHRLEIKIASADEVDAVVH